MFPTVANSMHTPLSTTLPLCGNAPNVAENAKITAACTTTCFSITTQAFLHVPPSSVASRPALDKPCTTITASLTTNGIWCAVWLGVARLLLRKLISRDTKPPTAMPDHTDASGPDVPNQAE